MTKEKRITSSQLTLGHPLIIREQRTEIPQKQTNSRNSHKHLTISMKFVIK